MSTLVHTLHVILAGAWLGGVVFTTAVVSPALKAMKWSEAERVGVRSVIGKQYARVEKFVYLIDICRHQFVVVYCVSASTAAMLFSQSARLTNDTVFTELPRAKVFSETRLLFRCPFAPSETG